jgi:hypothetical protein
MGSIPHSAVSCRLSVTDKMKAPKLPPGIKVRGTLLRGLAALWGCPAKVKTDENGSDFRWEKRAEVPNFKRSLNPGCRVMADTSRSADRAPPPVRRRGNRNAPVSPMSRDCLASAFLSPERRGFLFCAPMYALAQG